MKGGIVNLALIVLGGLFKTEGRIIQSKAAEGNTRQADCRRMVTRRRVGLLGLRAEE